MVKYTQAIENEDGWTDWIKPLIKNKHLIACCDCGLVHNFEFKNTREGVIFRASRNNRATGQKRRKFIKDFFWSQITGTIKEFRSNK